MGVPRIDAATPDAALVFADRALAFDHLEGACYVMALSADGDEAAALAWIDDTTRRVLDLPAQEEEEAEERASGGGDALVGMTHAGAGDLLELRHDEAAYLARIGSCLGEIYEGESYEVCLTNTVTSQIGGRPARDLPGAPAHQSGPLRGAARVPRGGDPLRLAGAVPLGRLRRCR